MKNLSLILLIVFSTLLFFDGCESENQGDNPVSSQNAPGESFDLNGYTLSKLGFRTRLELMRVRFSTFRYLNINNALEDGYVDINYFVPHMGWHFLNAGNLDGTFDMRKPELLVYTERPNGGYRLVAVEYATPWTPGSNPPEGFTGNDDVWSHFEGDPTTTDDDLWTLHAWVWYYNPDGIFNPFNPRVD